MLEKISVQEDKKLRVFDSNGQQLSKLEEIHADARLYLVQGSDHFVWPTISLNFKRTIQLGETFARTFFALCALLCALRSL